MSFQSSLPDKLLSSAFFRSVPTGWILDFREKAFEELLKSKFPDKSMEAWRKFPFANLELSQFSPFHQTQMDIPHLKNGSVCKFEDISGESETFLKNHLNDLLKFSAGDFFRLYNLAFFSSGLFVESEEKTETDTPVKINYNLEKNQNSISPLTIIHTKNFTNAKIVEEIISTSEENLSLVNSFTSIIMEDSSKLVYVTKEKFGSSTIHFRNLHSIQYRNSSQKNFYFNMGGYKGKTVIDLRIKGKGGFVESFGACALTKREFLDTDFRIKHEEGFTESKLMMKVVAKEKSHHIFTGNLHIPQFIEKVTASQMNKNLILNNTARTESIPKLEVFAHDIKCSHGATVGEIKDDEMFYLFSRGLKEDEAKALIVEGFFSEILDKLDMDVEKENIYNYFHEKLFDNGEI